MEHGLELIIPMLEILEIEVCNIIYKPRDIGSYHPIFPGYEKLEKVGFPIFPGCEELEKYVFQYFQDSGECCRPQLAIFSGQN